MTTDRYRTLAGTGEGVVRELASKFIARAFPIASESEFRSIAEQFGNEHPTARHVCYAWVLGETGDRYRANDDGEPTGTAGAPILRRIRALDLTYCGVAVVRYFGGTLLGKPGLIHAYGEAARLALDQAPVIDRLVMVRWELVCGYERFDGVKHDVKLLGGVIASTTFDERCHAIIDLPLGSFEGFRSKWELLGVSVRLHRSLK